MTIKKLPVKNRNVNEFIKLTESFVNDARGVNRGELLSWFQDDNRLIKKSFLALKKEQEICSMMHQRHPKKLNSFFYAPTLTSNLAPSKTTSSKSVELIEVIQNRSTSGALIIGTLGQGKSMLLRYFQFLQLTIGSCIPILLELQKIDNKSTIKEAARTSLNELGLNCSKKLFDLLYRKGHIALLLDGYDEIQFSSREKVNVQIKSLLNQTDVKNIFITSRYNTEIEKVSGLVKYEIQPLVDTDYHPFMKKLIGNSPDVSEIMKKIEGADVIDPTILSTPLLLTFFVIVYNKRKIPKTRVGFYEELFRTILSTHDGIKGSFDRPTKSGLTDTEIENMLHAFCYLTSKENQNDFSTTEIIKFIKRSKNAVNMPNVDPEHYLHDLTHVTCLLVKDGMTYKFMHESIQSYFSACFVKETNEENSKKFYARASKEWKEWSDELSFLYDLDVYRYNRFLIINGIAELCEIETEDLSSKGSIEKLSNRVLKNIYQESYIQYSRSNGGPSFNITAYYYPAYSYVCFQTFNDRNYHICPTDQIVDKIFTSKFSENVDFEKRTLSLGKSLLLLSTSSTSNLLPLLKECGLLPNFYNLVRGHTLDLINKQVKSSLRIIKHEESKSTLF